LERSSYAPKALLVGEEFIYAEGVARLERSSYTPKALANSSPGLERSDNPGIGKEKRP
jgi:hypothetical protein